MRKQSFFKYLAYSLEILLLYIVQYTPNYIPEIFGGKPLLLMAAALTIAGREKHIPSLVFGAVCGALMDLSGGGIGFFAVMLTLLCWCEAELFERYFVSRFISVFVVGVIAVLVVMVLYFVLFVLIRHSADAGYLLVNHYLSRTVYTMAMLIPLYPLNKLINKAFT